MDAAVLGKRVRSALESGRARYGLLGLPDAAYAGALCERGLAEWVGGVPPRCRACSRQVATAGADLFLAAACDAGGERAWGAFETRIVPSVEHRLIGQGFDRGEAHRDAESLAGTLLLASDARQGRGPLAAYRGRAPLSAWCAAIARHGALPLDRGLARASHLTATLLPLALGAAPGPDAARRAVTRERIQAAAAAIERAMVAMGPRPAQALVLSYGEGRRQAEAARLMDVTQPRVSRLLHGALRTLRSALRSAGITGVDRCGDEELHDGICHALYRVLSGGPGLSRHDIPAGPATPSPPAPPPAPQPVPPVPSPAPAAHPPGTRAMR